MKCKRTTTEEQSRDYGIIGPSGSPRMLTGHFCKGKWLTYRAKRLRLHVTPATAVPITDSKSPLALVSPVMVRMIPSIWLTSLVRGTYSGLIMSILSCAVSSFSSLSLCRSNPANKKRMNPKHNKSLNRQWCRRNSYPTYKREGTEQ